MGVEKLHNEELNDLYSSPHNIRVIKSTRMRQAGHVARVGGGEEHTGFWWGNLKERETTWKTRRRWEDNMKMDP